MSEQKIDVTIYTIRRYLQQFSIKSMYLYHRMNSSIYRFFFLN